MGRLFPLFWILCLCVAIGRMVGLRPDGVCRAPVAAAPLQAQGLLFAPRVMGRGVMAHYAAEAVLNAPQASRLHGYSSASPEILWDLTCQCRCQVPG